VRETLGRRLALLISHLRGPSSDHLLRALVGAKVRPADLSGIRLARGHVRKRLVIECDDAGFLYKYRREPEQAMQQTRKRLTETPEFSGMSRMIFASQQSKHHLLSVV